MKFKHYLKGFKIYYIISIAVFLAAFLIEIQDQYDAYKTFLTCSNTQYSNAEFWIVFLGNQFSGFRVTLKSLLIALTVYFIIKNFPRIYGKIKTALK